MIVWKMFNICDLQASQHLKCLTEIWTCIVVTHTQKCSLIHCVCASKLSLFSYIWILIRVQLTSINFYHWLLLYTQVRYNTHHWILFLNSITQWTDVKHVCIKLHILLNTSETCLSSLLLRGPYCVLFYNINDS